MADLTRTYAIDYRARTAQAKADIAGLAGAVAALDQGFRDSGNELAALGISAAKVAPQLTAAGRALQAMAGTDPQKLRALAFVVGELADGLTLGRQEAAALKASLDGLATSTRPLGTTAGAVGRIALNAREAAANVGRLGFAAASLAGQTSGVERLGTAVQGVQRRAYGAKMNVAELGVNLAALPGEAAGLEAVAGQLGAVGTAGARARRSLRGASKAARGLNTGLGSMASGLMALEAARRIAGELGGAINRARDTAMTGAERSIQLRDSLREVANLQGKAAPDDLTVRDHLLLRQDGALTDAEANEFQRRFYGSLPAGRDKGNISAETAAAMVGPAAALGTRTGMGAGLAGDLTASLANYSKVPTATAAAGQLQTIVDRLNEGRGDLQPLAESLLKTAGSTVGQGGLFKDLGEASAALGVMSNHSSPSRAGTLITAFQRAMTGFNKGQGDTLRNIGVESGDDYMTLIDKVAPLVERATREGRNPDADLQSFGFGNKVDREAIVNTVNDREVIRGRIGSTRGAAGRDGSYTDAGGRAMALNGQFLASGTARARIGDAAKDRAEFERFHAGEDLQERRRMAEANMLEMGQLDTPGSNILDTTRDLFGVLPMLGFRPSRQRRIDNEAATVPIPMAPAAIPAAPRSVDVPRAVPLMTDPPTLNEAREAKEIQRRQLAEQQRTNRLLEEAARRGPIHSRRRVESDR